LSSSRKKPQSEILELFHRLTKDGFCETRRSRLFCELRKHSELSLEDCKVILASHSNPRQYNKFIGEIDKLWNQQK
jgi:hypothetical protein